MRIVFSTFQSYNSAIRRTSWQVFPETSTLFQSYNSAIRSLCRLLESASRRVFQSYNSAIRSMPDDLSEVLLLIFQSYNSAIRSIKSLEAPMLPIDNFNPTIVRLEEGFGVDLSADFEISILQ